RWECIILETKEWLILLDGGAISIMDVSRPNGRPGGVIWCLVSEKEPEDIRATWSRVGFVPVFRARTLEIDLPLWIAFLLIAGPTSLLWYLDRRRPCPGHCGKCNYNLTGNTTGVCPECGAAVPRV